MVAGPGFRHASYEYDGTRPVLGNMIGGCSTAADGSVSCTGQFGNLLTNSTDVQGFSHSGFGTISSFHRKYPEKPLFESECCSCNTQRGENVCRGVGCATDEEAASTTQLAGVAVGDSDHPQQDPHGVESAFNADCLSRQTNTSNGVAWMSGSMVWTLFDYYGEPSFGGWPHVSSTFGSFDLAGFAKPAVWWYKSFWLLQIPDSAADKPFSSAGTHVVRIVESWEQPQKVAPSNTTDVNPCDANDKAQSVVFDKATGQLKDANGLCIDGFCANISVGCMPLKFAPCQPGDKAQQWNHSNPEQNFVNADNGGCMDLWASGKGPGVGVWKCDGSANQKWNPHARGFATQDSTNGHRCLSNGKGGSALQMDIHVYSDCPTVELFVNGASKGKQALINPQLTPTATRRSWATYAGTAFEKGNLTAVARDHTGAVMATHTVLTSGDAAKIVLSLDAPSQLTGTGAALLLDGQDAGLVRATIVDAAGQLVADSHNNVSFKVVSGPGRIVGSHNGDPQCHEPNQVSWHSAYHGLARATIMTTQDRSSPAWHRARLLEIDVNSGAGQSAHIVPPLEDEATLAAPAPIVIQASSPGLRTATISVPTSTDPADGVLAVAARSAGKKVSID